MIAVFVSTSSRNGSSRLFMSGNQASRRKAFHFTTPGGRLSSSSSSCRGSTTTTSSTSSGTSSSCTTTSQAASKSSYANCKNNNNKRYLSSPAASFSSQETSAAATTTQSFLQSWTTTARAASSSQAASSAANPSITMLLPVIGNAAYLALASGFLMTDMLHLRVLLVGGYTGLVAFHSLHARPLKIPLAWSAVFVLVNASAAAMLLMDQHAAPLSPEDQALYEQHFGGSDAKAILTKGQFYQLLQLAERVHFPAGTSLTRENEKCPQLYFLESGSAQVFHGASQVATIEPGGFVNDVAFGSILSNTATANGGAYGTIVVEQDVTALVWDSAQLQAHLQAKPDMERNMKYCLNNHLVKSLLRQREAAHLRQQQLQT